MNESINEIYLNNSKSESLATRPSSRFMGRSLGILMKVYKSKRKDTFVALLLDFLEKITLSQFQIIDVLSIITF